MIKWLKGVVRLSVKGASSSFIVNEASKIATIYDVEKGQDGEIIFSVQYNYYKKLVAYFFDLCYNVKVISISGFLPKLLDMRKRLCFVISFFAVCLAIIVSGFFVWKVEVVADENFNVAELESFLSEQGVNVGNVIFNIDENKLEREIYLKFQEVAFVSIQKSGTLVTIKVVPALDITIPISNDNAVLTSKHDGIVSRISVLSGTPAVKVGDKVAFGDILVHGYVQKAESDEKVACPALAEIYVKKTYSFSQSFDLVKKNTVRTGNVFKQRYINFFGTYSLIGNAKQVEFEKYDVEESKCYLFENNILPIEVKTVCYFETKEVYLNIDFDAVKPLFEEFAYNNAINQIYGDYEIVNKIVEHTKTDNKAEINLILQVELLA